MQRRSTRLKRSHTWTGADLPPRIPTERRRSRVPTPRDALTFFCLVRSESLNSVKQLVKFFEIRTMSEGRKTQVMLPDDRRLEILIQPKLLSGELLDIVSSHFNLKEKEYFGLSFKDDTSHSHWLQLDRRVLEHEFPKKTGPLTLYFAVRFFIESIGYLRDNATIELFYLQSRQYIFKGAIECDSESAFELAANALQAVCGDYTDDESARRQLKKLPLLPTSALQEHPSISYCEDQVIQHYRKLAGQNRGSSIVNYQTIVESLPTYGIHYYEVKDKSGLPWWLGLSHKGIAQFDYKDKKTPRKVFAWKQLENLYFRDKKFSIEVHDPKRVVHTLSSFNLYEDAIQEAIEDFDDLSDAISDPTTQVSVSRRTFGAGGVNVHAWFASSQSLTKCIWSMAVSQHQFYLDRKQSKSTLPAVRSMTDIAADLCQSTSSLPSSSSGDISRSNSAHSLTTTAISSYDRAKSLSGDLLDETTEAQQDMFEALKARREVLEEALRKKTEELRQLCLKESEYTGALPPEIPLVPGEPVPQVRRRVGTEFSLSPKFVNRDKTSETNELLSKLELEYELQGKIAKAAWKLYHDPSVSKQVRKQRRQSYHKAHQKLKELEKKLNELRTHSGKAPFRIPSSVEDLSEDSASFLDSDAEIDSPRGSPAMSRHLPNNISQGQVKIITSPKVEVVELAHHPGSPNLRRVATSPATMTSPLIGSPASPHLAQRAINRTNTPSPSTQRQYLGGYTPNAVYQTRTQYRNQTYPTFSIRSQSASSNQSEYDNVSGGFASRRTQEDSQSRESIHNLYNVNTHQTARYDSTDDMLKSDYEEQDYPEHHEHLRLTSKHGSLDGAYKRHAPGSLELNRYGSLEGHLEVSPSHGDELASTRYGSKRDSSGEYWDPVHPATEALAHTHITRDSDTDSMSQSGSSSHDYPRVTSTYSQHTASFTAHKDSTQFQSYDSYSNSQTVASPQWYESDSPSVARQQPPPHTPQYEVPTQTFVQQDTSPAPYVSESSSGTSQVMTVTKYQSYVEVSKPFEMSDYYKYSEKLRKQRTVETRQQKLETVLSGSEGSQSTVNASISTPNVYTSYMSSDTSRSPASFNASGSSYPGHDSHSNPNSPYPYQPHFQDSFYTNTPPSPGAHQSRSRVPQRGQSHTPPANYGAPVGARPYVPPQAMSCEPVRELPPSGQTTPHRSDRDDSTQQGTPQELSSFDASESLATAFSEEMLAWYEDHDQAKSSTLV